MDGKDAFYFMAGLALLVLAGSAMLYVDRNHPSTRDCVKAQGMQLTLPNGGVSCVSESTYRSIAAK